ncbi:hypothetical protein [Sediminibacter sp. Hel_I_10]|uniref:hypothetical protein n=1 Tax=Sediminibacter sp. Hel_I_10 TaxID=1392490 RepID=UPI00047C05AE|nr:hypothetical protein [Sediminibacter sp. Hel_I_10]
MKKTIYILVATLCLLTSCKNNDKKNENEDAEMRLPSEVDEEINMDIHSVESYANQKFRDYIELIHLKLAHPEFDKSISKELQKLSLEDESPLNYKEHFSVSQISLTPELNVVSDHTKNILLTFSVSTESKTFKDSIVAQITSDVIFIDGEKRMSRNIKFLQAK